ncbi:MAG: hypothetical protein NTX03_15470 [Bacteroidetes bacterium]|nr:hypothetical protein [Bacteroidota bacterium]
MIFSYATVGDIPAILDIADAQLGIGYLTDSIFELIEHPNSIFRVVKNFEGVVMGFCYSFLIASELLDEELHPTQKVFGNKIGVIKTIAVDAAFEGQGLGTALTHDKLIIMEEYAANTAMSIAWKTENEKNYTGILKNFNFSVVSEIPNYWYADSLSKNYSCQGCGEPPCGCMAVVYSKVLR